MICKPQAAKHVRRHGGPYRLAAGLGHANWTSRDGSVADGCQQGPLRDAAQWQALSPMEKKHADKRPAMPMVTIQPIMVLPSSM